MLKHRPSIPGHWVPPTLQLQRKVHAWANHSCLVSAATCRCFPCCNFHSPKANSVDPTAKASPPTRLLAPRRDTRAKKTAENHAKCLFVVKMGLRKELKISSCSPFSFYFCLKICQLANYVAISIIYANFCSSATKK